MKKTAIVIGAGIVGLATARALAVRGYQVRVFERGEKAVGASVRNFGMVWPIGQSEGLLYERALRSKSIWKTSLGEAGLWFHEGGSLHLLYEPDELAFAEEFAGLMNLPEIQVLTGKEAAGKSPAVNPEGLRGALWSANEMIVDPREAIAGLPAYLSEKFGVVFEWNTAVSRVEHPNVYSGSNTWAADEIYVCSGADFETLYPEEFSRQPLTKSKLQMMRLESQPDGWKIGPALCGALSFVHYDSFKIAPGLDALRARLSSEFPEYLRWGIHVMASQNGAGEITIGDSHEYGLTFDPFDREFINTLIISYLNGFARFRSTKIVQSWHGIYAKLKNGKTEIVLTPADGVTIINGLGGNGMTLSFGLCDEIIGGTYRQA